MLSKPGGLRAVGHGGGCQWTPGTLPPTTPLPGPASAQVHGDGPHLPILQEASPSTLFSAFSMSIASCLLCSTQSHL